MGEIKGSFDEAVAQKLCFSDRVCIVCRHRDYDYFNGYLIFVIDLCELVNGSKGVLQYHILLNYDLSMSVCGLDSTLYFVESLSCSVIPNIYILDVETKHQRLKLRAKHLQCLPPMFGPKRFPRIASIPRAKKILVFSSQFQVFLYNPNLADDGFVDDFDEHINFEMYDVGSNTWEKLPPLVILKVYSNGNFMNPSFFLLHGAEKTEIPRTAWDEDFGIYEISRYTLIDEDVFLVQLTCGVMLTLDLKSPSKGWKLYDEGIVTKPSSDQNLFVVEEKIRMPWCASDIGGDRKFGNAVAFPLSLFREDDALKVYPCSTITLLEGDKSKGHVCIVQGGVSRKSKHPQMVMDVGNVQAEVVASYRFVVPHRIKDFAPLCMFVCHPKQRMGEIKRSLDGAVVQHQQKLCFSDRVCFVCRVSPRKRDFDSSGHLIFVVDLSELVNGSEQELQYNYHLNYGFGMSACGLDCTLYFVQFSGWTMSRTVHTLDVETKHQGLKLGADDLGSLPPMLGPKRFALIASIPRTKKILVLSSMYKVFFHNPNLADDNNDADVSFVYDDDDDDDEFVEFVDVEMYDIGTNTWEKLPPPIIRKFYGGKNPCFFLLHGAEETEIPRNARDEDFEIYEISRYTFIDDDAFLVQLTCGIKLTLDLKSPSKGWKLYDEGMVTKPSSDQNLFIVEDKFRMPWCASDIRGDRKFGNAVAFPLSLFGEDDALKVYPCSIITHLESDKAKGHVCIVQGGVSRKSKHPQMVMDVGNVQGEVVASYRFEVQHRIKCFTPLCMFVCHPKQRMGEIKRSFDGAVAQQQQKLRFSDRVCFVCSVYPKYGRYGCGCDCCDGFKGVLIFVVDLSELVNGSKKYLQYNILLNHDLSCSVCGLDSTLYFVDSPNSSESPTVYTLYVETKHQGLKLGLDDLGSLPPMLGPKCNARIASIPSTKKILVFSSLSHEFLDNPNSSDDDDDDDDFDEYMDFEMYDVGTNTWEKLPPLVILKVFGNVYPMNPSIFLVHGDEKTEILMNVRSWDKKFQTLAISRYTLIDEDVFLVQLTYGIMLTLDLKSPSKGWKLYNEGMVTKPSSDQNLFVVKEETKRPWCASDIKGDSKFGNVVEFPLTCFDVDDPLRWYPWSTITPLESEEAKGHVCIVRGGVSRKSKHGQVIIDVGNVQAEVVASYRFEVPHRIGGFNPFCMFVYHPKQSDTEDQALLPHL